MIPPVGMTRGEGLRFGRLATGMDRVTNGYSAMTAGPSTTLLRSSGPNEQVVRTERKAVVGLRPSFSAHVRWCERRAPVWSCGTRERLEGEACGIPHLAKNERDVGHPTIVAGIEPKRVPARDDNSFVSATDAAGFLANGLSRNTQLKSGDFRRSLRAAKSWLVLAQVFGQPRIDRARPTRLGCLVNAKKGALHVAHHQPAQGFHLPVWGASLCQGE
jgi:hypothetical protein